MPALYDSIGNTYGRYRRPDHRIASTIDDALGGATRIASVGAGTGSYEPRARNVVGVEPSRVMIEQRPRASAPVVQGVAERLPFRDETFEAALAVLTVHHWPDPQRGLSEMQRIAPLQVVLTWDPAVAAQFWLVAEYLPYLMEFERGLPTVDAISNGLNVRDVRTITVPWDCTDGFLGAYWRRPRHYLDPDARAAISGLTLLDQRKVAGAMRDLERDLGDGSWDARHRELAALTELDVGYRLIIATSR